MSSRRDHWLEEVPVFRILRFVLLIVLVVLIVGGYYLYTKGRLWEVVSTTYYEKALPFVMTYWYELGVSIILFSLGFWCGRRSMEYRSHRK
jgi:hypothetical protein